MEQVLRLRWVSNEGPPSVMGECMVSSGARELRPASNIPGSLMISPAAVAVPSPRSMLMRPC